MNHRNLRTHIMENHDFSDELQAVLEAAAEKTAVGTHQHHVAIAIEAIGLGIDATQRYVLRQMATDTARMREATHALEKLILLPLDIESLTAITEVKVLFDNSLASHAQHLSGAFVSEIVRLLEIEETLIVGDTAPENLPRALVEAAGHKAFLSQPGTFSGWVYATQSGKLERMQCRCHACLLALAEESKLPPKAAVSTAVETYAGLGNAFYVYGLFLLEMLREELEKMLQGGDTTHNSDVSAESLTNDILSSFSIKADDQE